MHKATKIVEWCNRFSPAPLDPYHLDPSTVAEKVIEENSSAPMVGEREGWRLAPLLRSGYETTAGVIVTVVTCDDLTFWANLERLAALVAACPRLVLTAVLSADPERGAWLIATNAQAAA